MVNRRRITEPQSRVEVLNEGKIRKRKHQKADRCHRDDEKERRKDIAEQFERLKSFLPETKKNRTRQEVLSRTRELIWELWRNEEILSLASVDQMESKIAELEKLVVMKRDKKRQLESIKRTAAESNDYALAEEEAGEVEGVVDTTSRLIGDDISEPAEILTDELINRGEGYVLEEVLPADLYEQLVSQQTRSGQHTPSGDFKMDTDDAISEAMKIVQDTFKVEEINNDDKNESSFSGDIKAGSPDEIVEVDSEGGFERRYCGNPHQEGGTNHQEFEHFSQGKTSSPLQNTDSVNCENYDYNLNGAGSETRTPDQGNPYSKFPLTMPPAPYNHYFMPFQLWPAFVQPDQQMAGFPGFPMSLVPNPSCAYNNLPVPPTSPPARSSLDLLVSPNHSGQVIMNDYMVSEGTANVDVVN